MSGLEKFQQVPEWMERLKSHLLMNRENKTPPRQQDSEDESICLDLDEDLQAILREKTISNKENIDPTSKTSKTSNSENNIVNLKRDNSILNPSFVVDVSSSLEITNLSFSAIEEACNKSISDPNSTIHNYVKQIQNNKKPKSDSVQQEDVKKLECMFENLETKPIKYSFKQNINCKGSNFIRKPRVTLGFGDQTQLDDIDEPSILWETTTLDNNGKKQTPKNKHSFITNKVSDQSLASNFIDFSINDRNYVTAQTKDFNQNKNEVSLHYVTCELGEHGDVNSEFKDLKTEDMLSNNIIDRSIYNTSSSSNYKTCNTKNVTEDSADNSIKESLTIEISDDDFEYTLENKTFSEINENSKKGFAIKNLTLQHSQEEILYESPKKDENAQITKFEKDFQPADNTLENANTIKHVIGIENKTFAESKVVENVLKTNKEVLIVSKTPNSTKVGITSLSQKKSTKKILEKVNLNKINKVEPFQKSSSKFNNNQLPLKNSPFSSDKILSTKNYEKIRKPNIINNSSKIPQPSSITSIKKTYYADVISPIGVYINKTPSCLNEVKIKPNPLKLIERGQTTAKTCLQYNQQKRVETKKESGPSLPQKLYKSADYKCVIDERSYLNIPGGEKIHKYLKPALIPAVVRHDGKIKMSSPSKFTERCNAHQNVNNTITDLTDLSTISGDVSIHTIKNAQKFTSLKNIHK